MQWHPVFAWLPIRVGENDCRWLETVERKYPWARVGRTISNWPIARAERGDAKYRPLAVS